MLRSFELNNNDAVLLHAWTPLNDRQLEQRGPHPPGHEGFTCGLEQVRVPPQLQEPSRGLCLCRGGLRAPSCFYKVTFYSIKLPFRKS